MKFICPLAVASLSSFFSPMLWATDQDDHKAHYASALSSSSASKTNALPAPSYKPITHEDIEKIDNQIIIMRNIHAKMMSATSTEARKQFRAEHTNAMQGGMAMLGSLPMDMAGMNLPASDEKIMMNTMQQSNLKEDTKDTVLDSTTCDITCDMEVQHQMLEKRMQLMETLVQMMMDRMTNDVYDAPKSATVKK